MNVLPWLLDWPPSPASVAFFVLVTAFSVGTLALFGGVTDEVTSEHVTIEAVDLDVRLNDEGRFPDVESGTVHTCLASGVPGDRVGVFGDVTVDVPAERNRDTDWEGPLTVVVSLAHTEATTTATVSGAGTATNRVFWVFDDDETLAVGDTATVQVRVRADDAALANATRSVPVENGSRSYDC